MSLTRHRLRLELDCRSWREAEEILSADKPFLWRGTDCQFEIGLFDNDALVTGISNIATLTLQVKLPNDLDGASIMTSTLSAGSLDGTVTQTTWDAGTAQHALFTFTGAETAPDLGTNLTEKLYHVVVKATTIEGYQQVWGISSLRIIEPGLAAGASPTPAVDYYTKAEVDALIAAIDVFNSRFYNPDQLAYHTIQVQGAAGAEHLVIGPGSA